ncbi:SurA N-terminal domain-containing protein [Desulfosarcina ovata]|uniref:PpiC domain-containing protein n=1 Tax=Desulfosarcina ovata subsp. ovata TaxID=2752305 RepID=A0A5K8ANZ6_9BACT|nr:SurA N-terminal domain-containing protein [Desulfosarcina ovata]BBO93344.1 hypothetical protein DSCOOX_65240 [Desulfosarcina ovata subsp. ovata]
MLKRILYTGSLILALVPMLTALATASAASKVLDRIVAVVNEDIILLSELDARMSPYVQRIRQQGFDLEKEQKMLYKVREDMLNRLVDEKLTDQEIKRNDINVDDAEIDNAIERIKAANYYTDEDLRGFLEADQMTMEEYREKIKEQILRSRLVNYEVKSKIVITDEEVSNYYDNHPELYGGTLHYHLRNILLPMPAGATDDEKTAIGQKMAVLRAQFEAGTAFADLARTYSEGPAADNGGDIGEFTIDTFSPQIRAALDGLQPGQATSVLDTDRGFQLFYVEAVKRSEDKPLESVREEIHQKLYAEVVDKTFLSWLEDLRGQSHIKIIN